jgi:uncharacterized protein with PQ loop repeat
MIAALGVLAATLSISLVWPQVWLSCRRRRTAGLSPTSSWLAVALNLSWLTFGLLTGDPAQTITNAVVGVGNVAVLGALLVTQPRLRARRTLARTAGGAAALVVAAAMSVGAVALGTGATTVAVPFGAVICVVGAATACVQPLSLLRDRAQDLSGLSPARWWLSAGSCASWVGYGWLRDEPTVWMSAVVGLGCAFVVCSVLVGRRSTRPVATSTLQRRVVVASRRSSLAAPVLATAA